MSSINNTSPTMTPEVLVPRVANSSDSDKHTHVSFHEIFYNRGNNPQRDGTCAVCAEDITESQITLRHKDCGNCFHIACGEEALFSDTVFPTPRCPICRARVTRKTSPRADRDSEFLTWHLQNLSASIQCYNTCSSLRDTMEQCLQYLPVPSPVRGVVTCSLEKLQAEFPPPPSFAEPPSMYRKRARHFEIANGLLDMVAEFMLVQDSLQASQALPTRPPLHVLGLTDFESDLEDDESNSGADLYSQDEVVSDDELHSEEASLLPGSDPEDEVDFGYEPDYDFVYDHESDPRHGVLPEDLPEDFASALFTEDRRSEADGRRVFPQLFQVILDTVDSRALDHPTEAAIIERDCQDLARWACLLAPQDPPTN